MNSKNFTGGLLLGATVGLVTGILLAPDKGSDTVKKLSGAVKDKFNQLKGEVLDFAEDAETKAKYLADNGGKRVEELVQEGKEKVDDLKNRSNMGMPKNF